MTLSSLQLLRPRQLFQQPASALQTSFTASPSLLLSPQALVSQSSLADLASPTRADSPLDRFQQISGILSQRGIPATLPSSPIVSQAPVQLSAEPSPSFRLDSQSFAAASNASIPAISSAPMPRPRPEQVAVSTAPPKARPVSVGSQSAPLTAPRPQPRPVDTAPKPTAVRPTTTRQPLKDDFTFQFSEIGKNGGTSKEAQANCGPASAAMVLKAYGIQPPSMHALRSLVGAPTGSRRGPYALDSQQVGKAVVRTAAKQGLKLDFSVKKLSTNVERTLTDIRKGLAQGDKVILLSSGLNTLSQGHYMVIKEIRRDGSVVMNDSGRRDGKDIVYSKNRLAQALSKRVNTYHRENQLITFAQA